jgi:hypothetical protein
MDDDASVATFSIIIAESSDNLSFERDAANSGRMDEL